MKRYSAGMNRGVGRTREGWGHYELFRKATRDRLSKGVELILHDAGDLKKKYKFQPSASSAIADAKAWVYAAETRV